LIVGHDGTHTRSGERSTGDHCHVSRRRGDGNHCIVHDSSDASDTSDTSGPADSEIFDEPSRWRAQAARALGLDGDDLLAAVSPGAACPMVLRSLVASINATGRPRIIVDLGSGAGGISEWLRRHTGASVTAVEPAAGARQAAATLFPALSVRAGTAEDTGLTDRVADAAVLCGVLSLIDEAEPVFAEVERILRPGGSLAVADLFSAGREPLTSRPNVFRSVEQVTAALSARGWSIVGVGCGTPEPGTTWAAAAARVDEWIRSHCAARPAFAAWAADQDHLTRHMVEGDLIAACVVASSPA